ncbi:Putative aminoglycoside phosphotransferase, protein kinase-like domain superfamily [Colletotrichum destructivum]|uniref:Aminoglycoside phosphotransferase, protein kinase-like domain superfamily n=1 Tax=Colletotrichum destructivum TaxID=34406 RepID=A0AAX4I1D7_9PEZI|nr:Putative aminoglycoside phosphotransferase, protein kinase-like domain superfamily [Colletotrichum destructivum]
MARPKKAGQRRATCSSKASPPKVQSQDISPVDYDEKLPFPYNNFIYKITLSKPATQDAFPNVQPYTAKPPSKGVSYVILRLSNPAAEGLNHDNRVENEAAALYLARKGLASFKPDTISIVPAVYAWQPALLSTRTSAGSLGWILMDFKQGVPLDKAFQFLSSSQKEEVLGQLADIFSGIQHAPLPESLDMYGGFTVKDGILVHGQMTILAGGPWKTYADFWSTRLSSQLGHSESSSALQGWKPNGTREKFDNFLAADLDSIFQDAGVDVSCRALVHGDLMHWNADRFLAMNNVLFDSATNKITGLVDFDFSYISHPYQEIVASFSDVGGNIIEDRGPDYTEGRLPKALLTGSFEVKDLPAEACEVWEIAKAWDAALAARNTLKPRTIAGVSVLAQLAKLEGLLCPFKVAHPVFLKNMTSEKIAEERAAAEEASVTCLGSLGF